LHEEKKEKKKESQIWLDMNKIFGLIHPAVQRINVSHDFVLMAEKP
jgi:hypothetical protein